MPFLLSNQQCQSTEALLRKIPQRRRCTLAVQSSNECRESDKPNITVGWLGSLSEWCSVTWSLSASIFTVDKMTPRHTTNVHTSYETLQAVTSQITFTATRSVKNTFQHEVLQLLPHLTCTSFGLRRFSVAGPWIWNGLPHELRQCNTLLCFKSRLKTYYFRHHMDNYWIITSLSSRASDCVIVWRIAKSRIICQMVWQITSA